MLDSNFIYDFRVILVRKYKNKQKKKIDLKPPAEHGTIMSGRIILSFG